MTAVPGSPEDFRLSIGFPDEAVVAVTGELDLATAPDLAAMLDALVSRGHRSITVECNELSFIDAAGIGVLASAQGRLGNLAGELRVHNASDLAYRLFEITELVDFLHVTRRNFSSELDDADEIDLLTLQVSRLAAESARSDVFTDALSLLTTLIPDLITACDGASVTLRRGGRLITAASSDETALELDGVQYEGCEGPCVEAATDGVQIHAAVLADELRWPSFTTRARARGMESVLSSPLAVDDQPTGALNLYSRTPDAFLPADQDLALVFAALTGTLSPQPDATVGREFDVSIRDALSARDVIARAQGVLMERLGVRARDAFTVLRRESVRTSVPLRLCASEIVEQTQPPPAAPDLEGPSDA